MSFIEKSYDPNEKITVEKLISFLNDIATFSKVQTKKGYEIGHMEYIVKGAMISKVVFDLLKKIVDVFDDDQILLEYTYNDLENLMGLIFAEANLKFDFMNEIHLLQGMSIIYDDLMFEEEEDEFTIRFAADDDDDEDSDFDLDDTKKSFNVS